MPRQLVRPSSLITSWSLGIGKDEDIDGAPNSANTSLSCCEHLPHQTFLENKRQWLKV